MVIKLVRARPQIGKDSGVVTAKAQRTEMKTADAKRETMLNKPLIKRTMTNTHLSLKQVTSNPTRYSGMD